MPYCETLTAGVWKWFMYLSQR